VSAGPIGAARGVGLHLCESRGICNKQSFQSFRRPSCILKDIHHEAVCAAQQPTSCRRKSKRPDGRQSWTAGLSSGVSLFGNREPVAALMGNSGNRITCSIEELPENLQKIVKGFQMVPDATQRYKQLLYYASKLKPLAPEHHVQVGWVRL
jgi:hypothetical protein